MAPSAVAFALYFYFQINSPEAIKLLGKIFKNIRISLLFSRIPLKNEYAGLSSKKLCFVKTFLFFDHFLLLIRAACFISRISCSKLGKEVRSRISLLDSTIWSWPKMKDVKRNEFWQITSLKAFIHIICGRLRCFSLNSSIC